MGGDFLPEAVDKNIAIVNEAFGSALGNSAQRLRNKMIQAQAMLCSVNLKSMTGHDGSCRFSDKSLRLKTAYS